MAAFAFPTGTTVGELLSTKGKLGLGMADSGLQKIKRLFSLKIRNLKTLSKVIDG